MVRQKQVAGEVWMLKRRNQSVEVLIIGAGKARTDTARPSQALLDGEVVLDKDLSEVLNNFAGQGRRKHSQ
jgi:hypothetical protein